MKSVGSALLWFASTLVGIGVGMFVSVLIVGSLTQQSAVVGIVQALLFGAIVAGAQTSALWILKQRKFAIAWLMPTELGFMLIGLFLFFLDALINVPDATLGTLQVGGALIAAMLMFTGQWMLLRGSFQRAFIWLAAGGLSLVIALGVSLIATGGAAAAVGVLAYALLTSVAFAVMRPS